MSIRTRRILRPGEAPNLAAPHSGVPGFVHHPAAGPLSNQQRWSLANRPPEQRRKPPVVGATVGYRHEEGGIVVPAVVMWVQAADQTAATAGEFDPNVYRVKMKSPGMPERTVLGALALEPLADAWPLVKLRTRVGGATLIIDTREARLPGSAGWLPASDITPGV